MVLFTRMAASLGTIPFAVHSICMNIADIYWDYIVGFGKASMVTAGQSIGKKSETEWHAFKRAGIKWTFICSTAAFTLTAVFREEIFSFYSSDPEALAMSGIAMLICAVVNFPAGHALTCAGILRGSGKTASVAAYAFVSITILRPIMTAFFLLSWAGALSAHGAPFYLTNASAPPARLSCFTASKKPDGIK